MCKKLHSYLEDSKHTSESTTFPSDTLQKDNIGKMEASIYSSSVINYHKDVTDKMCNPKYFAEKSVNPDGVLKSKKQISQINDDNINTAATNMTDLTKEWSLIDREEKIQGCLNDLDFVKTNDITKINDEKKTAKQICEYFNEIAKHINASITPPSGHVEYAVAVNNACIKVLPTDDMYFQEYDKYDNNDDCNQSSSLTVNEAFVIQLYTEYCGKKYAFGNSDSSFGWVNAKNLAIFKNNEKQKWIDCWKVDINKNDFIVVKADKIFLEASLKDKEISKLMLPLGTILKLVSAKLIPKKISDGRCAWNNYVVYIPTRKKDGSCEKKICLISQHCDVSVGFLPLTQRNILEIGYNNLGNRFGWGNMLNSFDCSGLLKNIYKCFGFTLPRNALCQTKIPNHSYNISSLCKEQKFNYISKLPAGSILIFNKEQGYIHAVMYLGCENDKLYILHASGNMYVEPGNFLDIMTVIISSTEVYRGSGLDYLDCIGFALNFKDVDFTSD